MKVKSESKVAQSCPTLSDPMDCSLPGSSVHGIFQARVLEWGAIAYPPPSKDELRIKQEATEASAMAGKQQSSLPPISAFLTACGPRLSQMPQRTFMPTHSSCCCF